MQSHNAFTDSELIVLIKEGREAAFAELYSRYKGSLYLHAYRMLQDKDEAMDIVQEFFAAIWAKRETLVVPNSVNDYLYGSIRNRILNFIAHQKVVARYTSTLDAYLEAGGAATDERFMQRELIQLIETEVARLPTKMREVFELSRKHDLSHKQIAQQLNISDKTVKKQVSNAIKIIKLKLNLMATLLTLFMWTNFF